MSDVGGSGGAGEDRVLDAIRRLLADAAQGGQAKVDALVALSQRTVWIATWPGAGEGFRTLMNSSGSAALPIFTDETALDEAARRFGWMNPDGTLPSREVGTREAFRHAIAHNLQFVVVDIGSPHSLELERSEVEPFLTRRSRGDSGPYAGTGRLSSELIMAVRATPPPGTIPAVRGTPPRGMEKPNPRFTPPPDSIPAVTRSPKPTPTGPMTLPQRGPVSAPVVAEPSTGTMRSVSATFGGGASGVKITPLAHAPPDALLDALSDVLREYPEVEWACLCSAERGPTGALPTIGLRIDPAFRTRVQEISSKVTDVAGAQGAALDVLLLDDAALMRTARAMALVFHPWRR
jgi:hypothetical protein